MHRREFMTIMTAGLVSGPLGGCATRARALLSSGSRSLGLLNAAAFTAVRRFARTRFGRIAYMDMGSGPAALFLHGFPLNSFQWRGAIERLSTDRRCIAPDFLAMGFTEVAAGQSMDPHAQCAMLADLLDRIGITTVDLIASDSGGAVAQLFVVRYPTRVRTLLLTNCDSERDSPPPALMPVIELSRAGMYADRWLAPWLADTALARSPQEIGGMCYTDPAHPTDEAIAYYFAPLLSSQRRKDQVHQYAIALERNPLLGIESALRRSRVPTRVVWGTADTIFSAESPEYLDNVFGRSRGVRRLVGRRLFWPEELPDVIDEEARQLWAVTPTRSQFVQDALMRAR